MHDKRELRRGYYLEGGPKCPTPRSLPHPTTRADNTLTSDWIFLKSDRCGDPLLADVNKPTKKDMLRQLGKCEDGLCTRYIKAFVVFIKRDNGPVVFSKIKGLLHCRGLQENILILG